MADQAPSSEQTADDNDADRKPAARRSVPTAPSVPSFRSVTIARPQSLAGPTAGLQRSVDVIDKASYFSAATKENKKAESKQHRASDGSVAPSTNNWAPQHLRPVPAFYPLERSSRFVEDDLTAVVARVTEANRLLSVHAVYCDETATASLLTSENVEMHLSLWKTANNNTNKPVGIVIEIQRRSGDSIAFHRYSRCILDAAVGELDVQDMVDQDGPDLELVYSKKVQRLLSLENSCTSSSTQESRGEMENAIIAVEIAHGLIMKDRMDARQLGLESLCLLTDPKKTGLTTALLTSRVVLLGTAQDMDGVPEDGQLMFDEAPFQEIRQTILSLIQFRRIGDADEFEGVGEDETEEEEHITVLHNLALAVLANALDVIENEDLLAESAPEEVRTRARTETSESISERFMEDAREYSENREILKTLISELGKANAKPHNATLSAKAIGSLCRASEKARGRAKELGAKTVVQTALDVGTRTHLKLERETRKVMQTLTTVPSQDEA